MLTEGSVSEYTHYKIAFGVQAWSHESRPHTPFYGQQDMEIAQNINVEKTQ